VKNIRHLQSFLNVHVSVFGSHFGRSPASKSLKVRRIHSACGSCCRTASFSCKKLWYYKQEKLQMKVSQIERAANSSRRVPYIGCTSESKLLNVKHNDQRCQRNSVYYNLWLKNRGYLNALNSDGHHGPVLRAGLGSPPGRWCNSVV